MSMSESEKLIRRLYAITTEIEQGFDHQITQLLKLGCERFNLDIGILSKISGDKYTVMNRICPSEVDLQVGAEFELGATFCAKTMEAKGPLGFEHVKESVMCNHPAYIAFGLEAYIGIPVKVNNVTYGTLNFSSPHPRQRQFSSVDIDALSLMASWIGAEMQRRDNEEKLKEVNNKLLSYSKNLTEQTKELKEARKLSDQAAHEKSKFLATMSHEIRTPMNGVLGMAELLRGTELNTVQQDYLRTIQSSGKLLLSIINDILDYSKLDAGKVELESIRFNLEWLAYDVLEMMGRSVNRDVQLILDYQSDASRYFNGDPDRIRQVLFNIVGNAVKFTEQGFIRLAIRMSSNGMVSIIVEDSGIGIGEEQHQHLFQPFSQADLSTTRKYGGTGLGLAICHQLVELMHGEIKVMSEQDKGTSFEILFPLEQAFEDKVFTNSTLRTVKILLYENDALSRKVIQNLLLHFETSVTIVNKASLVLTELQQASREDDAYEIVIIGSSKVDEDTIHLAKLIHANPHLKQPTLLAMTSSDYAGDTKRLEEAGYSAYLNKPVRSDILKTVLERIKTDGNQSTGIITKHSVMEDGPKDVFDQKLSGHVLLVEDNEVNQLIAITMLQELGLTADLAKDGEQALNMHESNCYDLILMDCQMPVMDGYEATRKIRAKESNHHIPIVALTANATEADLDLCKEAGMDDTITKPYMPNDLVKVMEVYLKQKTADE